MWRQCDGPVTITCPGDHEVTMTGAQAAESLAPLYPYGDHVSDPRALVMRLLRLMGWTFVPGSIDSMRCPSHRLSVAP